MIKCRSTLSRLQLQVALQFLGTLSSDILILTVSRRTSSAQSTIHLILHYSELSPKHLSRSASSSQRTITWSRVSLLTKLSNATISLTSWLWISTGPLIGTDQDKTTRRRVSIQLKLNKKPRSLSTQKMQPGIPTSSKRSSSFRRDSMVQLTMASSTSSLLKLWLFDGSSFNSSISAAASN